MISDKNGNKAGILVELKNDIIDVEELSRVINEIANNAEAYQKIKSYVPSAAEKFDVMNIADDYLSIYLDCK